MKKLDYYVLDVFTDQRFKGNQLSVVYIENELTIEQYHGIAREFGYSETSFVTYSTAQSAFKVRSFTPAKFEVAGAGHNLLGAVCLALIKKWDIFKNQGDHPWVFIKDTKIPLDITEENGLPYVAMKQRQAEVIGTVPIDVISEAVGLSTDELALNDWSPNIVQTEIPHLMVPVRDLDALRKSINPGRRGNQILICPLIEHRHNGFILCETGWDLIQHQVRGIRRIGLGHDISEARGESVALFACRLTIYPVKSG